MRLFGLSISEIAGLLTILGIFVALGIWLFKRALLEIERTLILPLKEGSIQPLKSSLDNLANKIDGMEQRANEEHKEFKKKITEHDQRLGEHDLTLARHEEIINGRNSK